MGTLGTHLPIPLGTPCRPAILAGLPDPSAVPYGPLFTRLRGAIEKRVASGSVTYRRRGSKVGRCSKLHLECNRRRTEVLLLRGERVTPSPHTPLPNRRSVAAPPLFVLASTFLQRSLFAITGCSPSHWEGGTGGRSLPLWSSLAALVVTGCDAVKRSSSSITGCSPSHWEGGTGGLTLPLCTASRR